MTGNIPRVQQLYGPNGHVVAALAEYAGRITATEITAVADAYIAADHRVLDAARNAAWAAADAAPEHQQRAETAIDARVAARYAVRHALTDTPKDIHYSVESAAADAALAVALSDLIRADQFTILSAAWKAGIGTAAG